MIDSHGWPTSLSLVSSSPWYFTGIPAVPHDKRRVFFSRTFFLFYFFYFFIIFSYLWYREQRHKEQLLCQGQTKKLWWWYQSFRQTRKLFPAFIFLKIRMMSLRRTKFKKTRTSSSNRIIKEKRGNLMIEWFLSCQNSLQNSNVFPKKIKKKKKLFY